VATSSGTSALEIALRGAGVSGGETAGAGVERPEVIVPANTFFATAAAVLHAGATPRFADIDPATLSLSALTVEAALTPQVVAVIHVHIGGTISPEVAAIRQLCEARGLTLIEDAAHAHGSSWNDQSAGSWSRAAAFSFYPTKVVSGAEGGMILTSDPHLRDEAKVFRDQGKASFLAGSHVRLGAAWRLSEVQAAVALVHLRRLDEFIAVRRRVAASYDKGFADCAEVETLTEPVGSCSNFYKYPVLLAPGIDRATVKAELRKRFGVSLSGEVYATPLHREPIFAAYVDGPLPVAEDLCARQICLPVHSDMTDREMDRVVDAVRSTLAGTARMAR
jgi:perosamine synthetase